MSEHPKVSFQSTLKSADTEETLDIWFYRPIGYAWALLFRKLSISPNVVTIIGIFIGVGAGILFGYSDLTTNITGMLLLVAANTLDSADGQLARMTGNQTRLGRILDGLCGNLWFITIYIVLCIRMQREGMPGWIWALGSVAGACHIQQASMADYYRNIHLFFIKGKSGSEVDKSGSLKKEFRQMSWRKDFINKIFLAFYINYTTQQERLSPKLQKFMNEVRRQFGENVPEWLSEEFRAKDKPLMKYTNMLTFNTRIIALFISLFLYKPWLYFVFEITILNLMLFYMIYKQESISNYFYKKITS